MPAYQINWLLNERVIYGKLQSDYDVRRDTLGVSKRLNSLLDSSDWPVPAILDLTDLSVGMKNAALNALAQGEVEALGHPKLMELLVVDNALSIRRDTPITPQAHFGGRAGRLFPSVRDALNYARDKYGTLHISVN